MDKIFRGALLLTIFFTLSSMQNPPNPERPEIEITIAPVSQYASNEFTLSPEAAKLSRELSEKLKKAAVNQQIIGRQKIPRITTSAHAAHLRLLFPLMEDMVERQKKCTNPEELKQHLDQLTEKYSPDALKDLLSVATELGVEQLIPALERRNNLCNATANPG